MTTTLKIVIGAVIGIIIGLVGGVILSSNHSVTSQVPGSDLVGGIGFQPIENYDPYVRSNGGILTYFPISLQGNATMNMGGVISSSTRIAMVSGTTTPCAIATPAATSTLVGFSAYFTQGTSTAATALQFATSSTPFATTSAFYTSTSFTSSVYPEALTWEGGVNLSLVFPNTYIVFKEQAPTATGGFVQQGFCSAQFVQI